MKFLLSTLFIFSWLISTAQNGPGGVGTTNGASNLVLWLKANTLSLSNGANVPAWPDHSGYNNNASSAAGSEPAFLSATYNNQPSVGFTAANTDYLSIPDAPSLKPNNISIFCVGKYTTGTSSYAPFLIKTNTYSWTEGYGLTLNAGANATYTFINNWSTNFVSVPLAVNTATIFNTIYDNFNVQLFHNEVSQGVDPLTANIINSNNSLYIGISPNTAGTGVQAPLNGDVAEVIVFNRNINAAERILINNYLSAKYNINLGENDIYDEDNIANGNFDFDVAGIGRVNAANIHNDAKSSIVRINSAADLGDNEFLVWGHDNAAMLPTLTTDVPAGVQARAGRTWRVTETGDVGAVTMQFDLNGITVANPSDLRLLIDTDNDGLFADETPVSGAVSVGGGLYEFQSVSSLGDNMRFTIATINSVTLPIKITDFQLSNIRNKQVKVNWSFVSDNSIDFFEVYHSKDGNQWNYIDKKVNATNSSSTTSFSIINRSPFNGTSFYKLKIIYKDGLVEYSNIKNIQLNQNIEIKVYPNPASSVLFIEGTFLTKDNIRVYNSNGQDVSKSVQLKTLNSSTIQLSIIDLPNGIYILKSKKHSVSFQKN
jgi:Secretion system C-terminal sorting domain